MRDSQRSKVYAAERLMPGFWTDGFMPEVSDVKEFVDTCMATEWFRQRVPDMSPVRVEDGRGRKRARAYTRSMAVPRSLRSRFIVIHELAHICTKMDMFKKLFRGLFRELGHVHTYTDKFAGHGHEFCAIYLELVRQFISQEQHDALVVAFREKRVQFTPKLERTPAAVGV